MCPKTNCWGTPLSWLNGDLLLGFRKKKRVYQLQKKGQETPKEYRGLVRSCRKKSVR